MTRSPHEALVSLIVGGARPGVTARLARSVARCSRAAESRLARPADDGCTAAEPLRCGVGIGAPVEKGTRWPGVVAPAALGESVCCTSGIGSSLELAKGEAESPAAAPPPAVPLAGGGVEEEEPRMGGRCELRGAMGFSVGGAAGGGADAAALALAVAPGFAAPLRCSAALPKAPEPPGAAGVAAVGVVDTWEAVGVTGEALGGDDAAAVAAASSCTAACLGAGVVAPTDAAAATGSDTGSALIGAMGVVVVASAACAASSGLASG